MYSYEDRIRAVKLYIQYDKSFASVKRELGYPKHCTTLHKWYAEYQDKSDLKLKSNRRHKFSSEQKQQAIDHYYAHGKCISRTIRMLGFPSRTLLKQWLREIHPEEFPNCTKGKPVIHLSKEQKEQAVIDFCMRTGTAQEVADRYEVSRISLYNWKEQFLPERSPLQMSQSKKLVLKNTEKEQIKELSAEVESLTEEAENLRKQIYQLQLEKDVLQKAAEIIKKDQGISLDNLSNREKAIVINTLRNTYSLKELLVTVNMAKSSYCYQEKALTAPDKYEGAREQIHKTFAESYESYGYRRIYECVKKDAPQTILHGKDSSAD